MLKKFILFLVSSIKGGNMVFPSKGSFMLFLTAFIGPKSNFQFQGGGSYFAQGEEFLVTPSFHGIF